MWKTRQFVFLLPFGERLFLNFELRVYPPAQSRTLSLLLIAGSVQCVRFSHRVDLTVIIGFLSGAVRNRLFYNAALWFAVSREKRPKTFIL